MLTTRDLWIVIEASCTLESAVFLIRYVVSYLAILSLLLTRVVGLIHVRKMRLDTHIWLRLSVLHLLAMDLCWRVALGDSCLDTGSILSCYSNLAVQMGPD